MNNNTKQTSNNENLNQEVKEETIKKTPVGKMMFQNSLQNKSIIDIIEKRELKSATINFKIQPSLKEKLTKKSDLLNVPVSEILIKLIEMFTDDVWY